MFLSPERQGHTPSPGGPADPKPKPRFVASSSEWDRIRSHFAFQCCVNCGLRANHLHHIAFKKADRGDDVIPNLAPMCGRCHDRFHTRAPGWERIAGHIRAYITATSERYLYALDKLGLAKLNRRYPSIDLMESEDVEGFCGR